MGAFDYLIKHGGCDESAYPYQDQQGTPRNVTSPYRAISNSVRASRFSLELKS